LTEAINIYGSDEYKRMSLNAIKTSYSFVDINRVLETLYFPKQPQPSKPQAQP